MRQFLFSILILFSACTKSQEKIVEINFNHTYNKLSDSPEISFQAWHFHICKICKSVDGGCYFKNAIDSIRTEKAKDCTHKWELVSPEIYLEHCKKYFPNETLNYGPPKY